MFIQAGLIPDGTVLEADLCVVGAGAAGITLARSLDAAGRKVLLLESGPLDFDEAANELNAGESVGRPYLDLATCRQRFFGGTTNHWGGWCAPQDRIDFERGWPITAAEMEPHYRAAQPVVQIGPFEYDITKWGVRLGDVPAPFAGPHFVPRMLQNSPPTRFAETYGPELRRSDRVRVLLGATVVRLAANPAGTEVDHAKVASLSGRRFVAKARGFVLACGGVENPRVLLLSGLGNAHDQVGRCFMVHLESPMGAVALADRYADFQFYTNTTSNGRMYAPFRTRFVSTLGLSEATMRARNLPNFRMLLDFTFQPEMAAIRAAQGLTSWAGDGHRWADMRAVLGDLDTVNRWFWRRLASRQALPLQAVSISATFEPTPIPDSRLFLGSERDALGQRRLVLDWRIEPLVKSQAWEIAQLLGAEVGRAGLGRMRSSIDSGPDWPAEMYGDQHHMGTTRMSREPANGVVDTDCRVHGMVNLWVAGSSVFPKAGVANPTLTIVALALRLAQHLRSRSA